MRWGLLRGESDEALHERLGRLREQTGRWLPRTDESRPRGGGVVFHPLTHALVGWVVACFGRADRRTRLWCLAASLAPDLDGLSLLVGLDVYAHYHHLVLHNLLFGVFVTLVSAYWIGLRPFYLGLVLLAFLSHLVGDYFGSGPGWELWPFLPFSDRTYVCECAWDLVSWQNTLITVVAIAVTLWAAVRQGHTPLEFLHARLEQTVVKTLQRRWRRNA
ncbi:MAG: hypothetical protein DME04_23965 [Candidatus Rokuibacteriota bacterium]|nr:MAG: hypothetical protein DME04_23965 [Candidatus Rokubacteria bacterium]